MGSASLQVQPFHYHLLVTHTVKLTFSFRMQGSLLLIVVMTLIFSAVAFRPIRTNSVRTSTELDARHGWKNWRAIGAALKKTDAEKNGQDKAKWDASKVKWEAQKTK